MDCSEIVWNVPPHHPDHSSHLFSYFNCVQSSRPAICFEYGTDTASYMSRRVLPSTIKHLQQQREKTKIIILFGVFCSRPFDFLPCWTSAFWAVFLFADVTWLSRHAMTGSILNYGPVFPTGLNGTNGSPYIQFRHKCAKPWSLWTLVQRSNRSGIHGF